MISRRRALGLVAAPFLVHAAGVTRPACAANGGVITIATGPYGGIYYPLGNSICRLFNRKAAPGNAICIAADSVGSVSNIRALRDGTAQFALAQSDIVVHALTGQGDFAGDAPTDDLRTVMLAHDESFTLLTRRGSGIYRIENLPGRRLATGPLGSGQKVTAELLLAEFGWNSADFAGMPDISRDQEIAALCNGGVDAVTLHSGHPNGYVQEAISNCDARIIPIIGPRIDHIVNSHAEYYSTVIPGGTYENHPAPTRTFATQSVLLTTEKTDSEIVAALLAAVFDNLDILRRLHPAFAGFEAQVMVPQESWAALHPGARSFYVSRQLLAEP